MSIRLKTICGIAAIEAVLLGLLIFNNLAFLHDSNIEQLDKRAKTTAELFAVVTKTDLLSMDLASLDSQVEQLVKDPAITHARVVSVDRGVLAQRARDGSAGSAGEYVVDARADITEQGIKLGHVEVGVSDEGIGLILRQARRNAMVVGGLGMTLSALFSTALGYYLTRQLSRLTEASKAVAAGRLDHRISVRGRDELAEVATAFNLMSGELAKWRGELERRIGERTAELARSNERLTSEAAERRQAHRDISQLVAAISAILIGLDTAGRVSKWNAQATAVLGLAPEDALGREFAGLPLPWEWSVVAEAIAACRRTREPAKANNVWYERGDGREGFLVVTVSPMLGEGG